MISTLEFSMNSHHQRNRIRIVLGLEIAFSLISYELFHKMLWGGIALIISSKN
jgi:hypothetical protein